MIPTLFLKPERERSVLQRHPWIFAGAVARVEGHLVAGATAVVRADNGRFLARAAFSPLSQIRARVWSLDEAEPIDHAFFKRRIAAALAFRRRWVDQTSAVRLIFGEVDGLPGLIVDRYADQLVCQFTASGVEHWKQAIVAALVKESGCANVYERSDVASREREGLPRITGVLSGVVPEQEVEVVEGGVRYGVDVLQGHKTGFYIDQRESRRLVREHAQGRVVLNCFCYTGGFSLAALAGGAASVLSIDSSGAALALAQRNLALNGFDPARAEWDDADVFKRLREMLAAGRQFDLIVLDPPKFAPSAAAVERAARAYKEINLMGWQLLRPGGLLFTFSCSGAITPDHFQQIVAAAASDAKVEARLVQRLSAGRDHPQRVGFPEGEYLKGLLLERCA